MPDRAEQYHAGDEAEQLDESDDEAEGADEVEPLDKPVLDRGGTADLVPVELAVLVVVLLAAVALARTTAGVRDALLLGPGLDVVPVVVLVDAAALELQFFRIIALDVLFVAIVLLE